MKRAFALTMVWAGLTVPLMAVADSGAMMGGNRLTPMMSGDPGTQSMPGPRAMARMSEGEVRKVDSAVGKLTLQHGPLENLDMPAMTMVFRVKDPDWLAQLKVGDRVRFIAQRVDGNLTVTALEPEKQLAHERQ
jgi:Cu/Ag efflux protein CusF